MTIKNTDIKLFMSQDNTDNPDGGGFKTSNVLPDGGLNNSLPDISRIDTVGGAVNLRKFHPVVDTDSNEIYYGAHAILTKTPDDPNVSALLFSTDSPSDVRVDAQAAIESYVVASYEAPFYLFGAHVAGAKSITWLQRLTESTPDTGEVYMLQSADGLQQEYVRISSVEPRTITLSYEGSDYTRRRVIAEIEQPLEIDHIGASFHPDGQTNGVSTTFVTQVADAAKFYGTKPLSADGSVGDLAVYVDDITEQIVPASKTQTPIINRDALLQGDVLLVPSGGGRVISAGIMSIGSNSLGSPVKPGSFAWQTTYIQDDGLGNLINVNGANVGTIDYTSGNYNNTGTNTGGNVTFVPMVVQTVVSSYTGAILISQENQGTVFVKNVSPMPSLANFYINYHSNGKWYQLNSNLDGTIGGDNLGAGNINDNGDGTGTISVSLGGLPDIDSSILFTWGSDVLYKDLVAELNVGLETTTYINLPHPRIDPTSLVLTIYSDIYGQQTVTFNSSGVGSIPDTFLNPQTGVINGSGKSHGWNLVNGTNGYAYDYAPDEASDTSLPVTETTNSTVDYQTLRPGLYADTAVIVLTYKGFGNSFLSTIQAHVKDGNLVIRNSTDVIGTVTPGGLITLAADGLTQVVPVPANSGAGYFGVRYNYVTAPKYIDLTIKAVLYQQTQYSGLAYTNSVNVIATALDGISHIEMPLPNNTVGVFAFKAQNREYYAADGNIYYEFNDEQVGVHNLTDGLITLNATLFVSRFTDALYFTQIFTDTIGAELGVTDVAFKTSATKLTTSSFQLRYSTINGSFNASSDGDGVVSGTDIDALKSRVDTKTGMAEIFFTSPVIEMDKLKYDAVAETNLPLDPELLGLNPVRLPADGKVPIYHAGRYLVIMNEVEDDIVLPVADATITLPRTNQAYVEVVDVNGQRLAYDQYVADKTTGVVTFANPLLLIDRQGDALTAPYRVIDRIEDMALCTSADLSGVINLSSALTRDYPAATSKIASALVWGNVGSRLFNLYSQTAFIDWESQLHGVNTAAQFDIINNPITFNNKDSFSGHFAIEFITNDTIRVREETLGIIESDLPITADIAPINPATGLPYFTIPYQGFGAGWLTGNVIYFEMESGSTNFWLIRTVQSGTLTLDEDIIDVEIRGDAN